MAAATGITDSYMADYLSELNEIKSSVSTGDVSKIPEPPEDYDDDGEKEFDFLIEIGLGKVANKIRAGDGIDEEALAELRATLTANQAATVQRHASRLHETTHRRKQKRRDVRDIFQHDDKSDGGVLSSSGKAEITSVNKSKVKGEPPKVPSKPSPQKPKTTSTAAVSPVGGKRFGDSDGYFTPPSSNVKSSIVQSGVRLVSLTSSKSPNTNTALPSSGNGSTTGTTTGTSAGTIAGTEDDGVDEEIITPVDSPTANAVLRPSLSRRTRTSDEQVTYIDDYGKKDIKSIAKFSLVEVETKFDQHKISYSKRKSKKKPKDHGVFGVPLQTLLDRDSKKFPNLQVPLVFKLLIEQLEKRGLKEVGILRVPGNQARIKALREELDSSSQNSYKCLTQISDTISAHDLSGLLKLLLRELPAPLLTLERMDAFVAVLQITDEMQRLEALNLLLLTLPEVNRDTLRLLLKYLREVVACLDNKMTVENVSLIMAPNLFMPGVVGGGGGGKLGSTEDELRAAAETSNIVKLLINYQQVLFEVPDLIVSQVRNEMDKKTKAGKKTGGGQENRYTSNSLGPTIQIAVSLEESSVETLVTVTDRSTAHDVISQIMCPKQTRSPTGRGDSRSNNTTDPKIDEFFLYEVGGNIGERRLHHKSNMLSVHNKNPQAKYSIRTRRA